MGHPANGHSSLEIPSILRYQGYEDVYIDQANQLTVKDLFSLHPTSGKGQISSSVVDSYLNILAKCCPGNICFIKSAPATLIATNQTPRNKPYETLSLAFVKKMVFPILLRSHWILLVADHQNRTLMRYDPAGNEPCLNEVERNIKIWYSDHKMSRFERKLLREACDYEKDEFVDKTGTDGGAWILHEVWKIARDDIAVHERPSPYELRMRIFLELINGVIFEEPRLNLDQLHAATRKLDRIVQSSVRTDLRALAYSLSGQKEEQGTQTEDFVITFRLSDLKPLQQVYDLN